MAGSHSGQPEAAVTRVTFSHIWFLSFLSGAWEYFGEGCQSSPCSGRIWEGRGVEGWGGVTKGRHISEHESKSSQNGGNSKCEHDEHERAGDCEKEE